MKREDIYDKLFAFEFCEPAEKAARELEYNEVLAAGCAQSGTPLYVLKPAILKTYPKYRAERLSKEMPQIPPAVRRS